MWNLILLKVLNGGTAAWKMDFGTITLDYPKVPLSAYIYLKNVMYR